jgi:hypothetical protein
MQSSEGKARVDSTMRDEAKRAFGFSGERVTDDQELIAMRDYRYLRCVLSGTVPSVPTHHLSTSFGPRAFSRGILISALLFSKRFHAWRICQRVSSARRAEAPYTQRRLRCKLSLRHDLSQGGMAF